MGQFDVFDSLRTSESSQDLEIGRLNVISERGNSQTDFFDEIGAESDGPDLERGNEPTSIESEESLDFESDRQEEEKRGTNTSDSTARKAVEGITREGAHAGAVVGGLAAGLESMSKRWINADDDVESARIQGTGKVEGFEAPGTAEGLSARRCYRRWRWWSRCGRTSIWGKTMD